MNRFDFHGHHVLLSADGVVFLTETSTLVAADLHLGKSAVFRANGLPVPEGDTSRDLQRLEQLAAEHQAAEIVIAGDLFHGTAGITPEITHELDAFIRRIGIPFLLTGGNHDAKIATLPCGLVSEPFMDRAGVRILHDPADSSDPSVLHLAGHWHPVAKIRDGKRTTLRLPCFLLRKNLLVLPSFGSFTGGAVVPDEAGDRLFVALRDRVVELPPELRGKNG